MASIEARSGPRGRTYTVRYRDPAGRQREKSFKRKADAQHFATEVETDKRKGTWVDPSGGRQTFGSWAETWLATTGDLRRSTRARVEGLVANYLVPRFGSARIAAIRQPDVQQWVNDLRADGLKPASVRKTYNVLTKMMRGAVSAGLIAQSPCRDIRLPKIESEEMRFLSPEEIGRLVDAIDPRYRALVLVMAYGGLRWGEAAALRVGRLHLPKGEIEVVETLTEVNGVLEFGPPKTKAAVRRVPIPRAVADELGAALAGRNPKPTDLVFVSPDGKPLRSLWRSRFFYPAVEEAGLGHFRIHDLRHTAVALWIASGAHVREIQQWAGHASAVTILNVYGHVFETSGDRVRSALDQMIAAVPKQSTGSVTPLR